MNYELVKKLKEAGFPQKPFWEVDVNAGGGSWYYLFHPDACANEVFASPDEYKKGIERGDELVKIPTLSELIKECRRIPKGESDNRDGFILQSEFFDEKGMLAEKWRAFFNLLNNYHIESSQRFDAETPEEAVANLWLTLKETK